MGTGQERRCSTEKSEGSVVFFMVQSRRRFETRGDKGIRLELMVKKTPGSSVRETEEFKVSIQ